jgi:hypothetical protein
MFNDPIVQEVRAIREKIAAECGYEYHKILLRGQEICSRYKDQFKFVTKEELDQLNNPTPTPTVGDNKNT